MSTTKSLNTIAAGAMLLLQFIFAAVSTSLAAPVIDWSDKTYDRFDINDGTLFKAQPEDQTAILIAENKIALALKLLETRLSTYGDIGIVLSQAPLIIDVLPKNRYARELLALALSADGDIDAAKEHLASLPESDTTSHLRLAAEAMIARKQGKLEAAADLAQLLLSQNPKFAYGHSLAGLIAFERQDLPTALKALEQAVALTDQSGPYYLNLGTMRAQSGDATGAEQAYMKAYRLMGETCAVAIPIARYQISQSNDSAAKKLLTDCLTKQPTSNDEAFAYYAALSVTEDPATIFKQALYAEHSGHDKQAQAAYERFVVLEPENYAGLNQLAWFYASREMNLDQAKVLVTKALELRPGNAGALDTLGWIYYLNGDFTKAVKTLAQAYAVSGIASEEITLHLAKAKLAAGDAQGTEELLSLLIKGEKDSPFKQEAREILTALMK